MEGRIDRRGCDPMNLIFVLDRHGILPHPVDEPVHAGDDARMEFEVDVRRELALHSRYRGAHEQEAAVSIQVSDERTEDDKRAAHVHAELVFVLADVQVTKHLPSLVLEAVGWTVSDGVDDPVDLATRKTLEGLQEVVHLAAMGGIVTHAQKCTTFLQFHCFSAVPLNASDDGMSFGEQATDH